MRDVAVSVLSVVAAALATACVQERTRPSLFPNTVSLELRRTVVGVGYDGVVFTPLGAGGESLLGFTPSDLDIANMEARLPGLLAGQGPFRDAPPPLADYVRQYSGSDSAGRPAIQTNFIDRDLASERGLDWRNQRIRVDGAGRRFFQVWYDVGGRRITQLLASDS